jgi:hypothetical protein
MARHVSFKIDGENRQIFKVHSSDVSKTFWNNLESNLNFITISEEDFKKLKYSKIHRIDTNNNLNFLASPEGAEIPDITQYTVEKKLDEHIKEAEFFVKSHDNSTVNQVVTQDYINSLKAIDTNAITWPVNCNNWIEALELNSHLLDSVLEV